MVSDVVYRWQRSLRWRRWVLRWRMRRIGHGWRDRSAVFPIPHSLQLAHAAGVPVVLDAGGATDPLSPDLLRCLTVISPNETELQGLTGERRFGRCSSGMRRGGVLCITSPYENSCLTSDKCVHGRVGVICPHVTGDGAGITECSCSAGDASHPLQGCPPIRTRKL